jgi:hypothetical protein
VPRDDGLGTPGDGSFNTPPLVEAADTGPFFHNNAIETIEGAVGFYDGESFNNSPSGQALARLDPQGVGIELDGTQIVAIAAFLRVVNALENIRQSLELLDQSARSGKQAQNLLRRAVFETRDSIEVLEGGGLHPQAVAHLREALELEECASKSFFLRASRIRKAVEAQQAARAELIETSG